MPKKAQPEDGLKELRSRITKAPQDPGIYRWMNADGDVLYVGKAKNLKNRLKSYVQKSPDRSIGPWKLALRENIADVDWTVTETELEALILETNLIKDLKPKYNVMMKDDKNYVYVRIGTKESYPTVSVVRQIGDDNAKYFGPFLSAFHIKRTIDMLHDVYKWRSCDRSIDILNHNRDRDLKPCLDFQIGKCNGLCAGKITQEEYRQKIESMMRFFKGDRSDLLTKLKEKMQRAAEKKLFEEAAKLRDTFNYIESLEEQQIVSDTTGANTDIFGVALLAGHSHVVVLREREGKLIGEQSFALAGHADTAAEVLEQFLPQYYIALEDIPDTVIFAEAPEEMEVLANWLSYEKGKKVVIHVPERGKKSKLLQMAEKNAEEKITQQLAKWEAATKKVEGALFELKEVLNLPEKPRRIECYDISHLGGTETVGSMVVFIDGKAKNGDYRSFTLRTIHKGEIDDYKALKEVLMRRLRHLKKVDWEEQGISFGKAKKGEQEAIEGMITAEDSLSSEHIDYKDFFVARKEEEIIAFGRLIENNGGIHEIKSVWVSLGQRGKKLGHALVQRILRQVKKGKVYVILNSELEEYYAQLGFRHVITPPPVLQKKTEKFHKENPDQPIGIIMMYESKQNRPDSSLGSRPDLLVLDGGKGQLSTIVPVLKNMEIDIPIIALAKREEEVFIPESSTPLPLPHDSEGRFLLMRLRDEAHRFANRHREKRLKNALIKE